MAKLDKLQICSFLCIFYFLKPFDSSNILHVFFTSFGTKFGTKTEFTRMNKGIVKELVGVDELFWRRYFVTYGAPSERLSSTVVKCRNALFYKGCKTFTPSVLFHLFASFSTSFGSEFGSGSDLIIYLIYSFQQY